MFTTLGTRITSTIAAATVAAVISAAAFGASAHAITLSNGTPLPNSAFVKVDASGQPARWDPCAPAYWKLFKGGLPHGSRSAVALAMRQLKKATGINFVYRGGATAAEMASPPAHTIVIGFSSRLSKTRAGIARSTFGGGANDSLVILSSQVLINLLTAKRAGSAFPEMLPVLLHELGHAVGIGHSSSIHEIMNSYVVPVYRYQGTDVVKLAAVGAQNGCHPLA
jgi:hypothetical protein